MTPSVAAPGDTNPSDATATNIKFNTRWQFCAFLTNIQKKVLYKFYARHKARHFLNYITTARYTKTANSISGSAKENVQKLTHMMFFVTHAASNKKVDVFAFFHRIVY